MKLHIYHIAMLLTIGVVSCKKDNYDPPTSKLTGHLVYKGETFGLEYDQVKFEMYQYGFGKTGPIASVFEPDGSYSMLLFNGEYKFIIPNGQGPFVWKQTAAGAPDTTIINLQGSQVQDLEVTPYYMIRNPQLTRSGSNISGTFKIEKIITGASARNVEEVDLYINKTTFVSGANNVAVKSMSGSDITDPDNVNLTVAVPALTPAQPYVYARIGLKIAGVEDRIFSPMVRIDL
jgi:hypothetical protein